MNYDINSLRELVKNRDIFIFSLSIEGLGLSRFLRKEGFNVKNFVDSRNFPKKSKDNIPIIHPDDFFKKFNPNNAFVILASKNKKMKNTFLNTLEENGFLLHKDVVRILEDLCDYMPTIEIVGNCNLRCISCECGHKDAINTGFMSPDMYKKVLEKMRKEIPFFNSVYLYLWGEPLLHSKIDEIIKISKDFGIAVDVSTNLNFGKYLEKFISSGPDYVAIPCSGVGENYEITHTGGKWEVFEENLYKVREYLDKYNVETVVRIMFHIYKHNIPDDYYYVKKLAQKLNFQFYPIIAQAFPGKIYEFVVNKQPLPEEILELNKYLLYPIEDQLKYAYEKRHTKCPVWKVFPTIRSDGSVLTCCNLMHYTLHRNFLDTTLDELNALRENNELCQKCMSKGLHRYFDVACEVIEKDNNTLEVKRL